LGLLVAAATVFGVQPSRSAVADFAIPSPAPREAVAVDCRMTSVDENQRAAYRAFASCEARKYGLPEILAHAVIEIESAFNPGARGRDGEVGLMQVMPGTAHLLGFRGTLDELAQPETNIALGVRYLAQAHQLAGGDLCTTVMKYRAGHGESRFSALSVRYCEHARYIFAREGVTVTGRLPVATFGFASASAFGSFSGTSSKSRGVCIRRLFVPGPRYMSCAAYRKAKPAKQIVAKAAD
jgi:soluble lytic murein transglycosylase-like protein